MKKMVVRMGDVSLKVAISLMKGFFKENSQNGYFTIKNGQVYVEIMCPNSTGPIGLIDEISNIDGLDAIKQYEFYYKEEEDKTTEESGETQQPVKPRKEKEAVEIPRLAEIKASAKSWKEFIKLVSEEFQEESCKKQIEEILKVIHILDKISWENITKRVAINVYQKRKITNQIAKRFGEGISFNSFFKQVAAYKNYYSQQPQETSKDTQPNVEGTSIMQDTNPPKEEIHMQCIPKIPFFARLLGELSKKQGDANNRIQKVLIAMEIEECTQDIQTQIKEIFERGLRLKEIRLSNLTAEFEQANILAEFINNFVSKYEDGRNVSSLDFFTELQKIIMRDDEINS